MSDRSKEVSERTGRCIGVRRRETDVWPATEEEQNQLIIRLQDKGPDSLRWREPDVVRREQVVDATIDRLMARRDTNPPSHPSAWFRTVTERRVTSDATTQRRSLGLTWEPEAPSPAMEDRAASRWLRVRLDELKSYLTWREFRIVTACLTFGTLAAVSHALGEHPSNLERAIRTIGDKIRPFFPDLYS